MFILIRPNIYSCGCVSATDVRSDEVQSTDRIQNCRGYLPIVPVELQVRSIDNILFFYYKHNRSIGFNLYLQSSIYTLVRSSPERVSVAVVCANSQLLANLEDVWKV